MDVCDSRQESYFHFAYVSKDESSPGFSGLVSYLSLIYIYIYISISFHNPELKSPSLQTEPPLATLLNTSTHIPPPQRPRTAPSAHTYRTESARVAPLQNPQALGGRALPAARQHRHLNPPLIASTPFSCCSPREPVDENSVSSSEIIYLPQF